MECIICGKTAPGGSKLCDECRYPKEGHKRCLTCLEVKPFSSFNTDKWMKDGYSSYCRECSSNKHKKRDKSCIKSSDVCLQCGKKPRFGWWYASAGRRSNLCLSCVSEILGKNICDLERK